ncbi:MAG TPA: CPBP family intramembrane glutamic endopeptidase [Gemmatimonadales bacterium]|nr:CPBP family intramembrane glutamic endopeptidase [Gemmatimonadales bacterium]
MPPTPSATGYWRTSRAPRHSLTFALPLLLSYELLAFTLSGHALAGVRNGADVLLKSLFVGFGGRTGLVVFGAILLGTGTVLVGRDLRRGGRLEPRLFPLMTAESVVYATVFGLVVGTLTGLLLGGLTTFGERLALQAGGFGLATQLMISLGAGIYEELLFRVLLVGALAWAGRRLLGWRPWAAGVLATVVGALVFSGFHYIGPYGDPLELPSFTFRALAGLVFSAMYLTRGFGITAWTHALYDVFLTLG